MPNPTTPTTDTPTHPRADPQPAPRRPVYNDPPRTNYDSRSGRDAPGWAGVAGAAFIALVVGGLLMYFFTAGGGDRSRDEGSAGKINASSMVGPAASSSKTAKVPAPAATDRDKLDDSTLPPGVYRDKNGQLRSRRAAPDMKSDNWLESKVSCRGKERGEKFRCESAGVEGWCQC